MAMTVPVFNNSKFCRFCGNRTTSRGGFTWCENLPLTTCRLLKKKERLYCELCGEADPREVVCRHCTQLALHP